MFKDIARRLPAESTNKKKNTLREKKKDQDIKNGGDGTGNGGSGYQCSSC